MLFAALTGNRNNICSTLLKCLPILLSSIVVFSRHIFKCSPLAKYCCLCVWGGI